MKLRPPVSTRTATLFPDTPLVRSFCSPTIRPSAQTQFCHHRGRVDRDRGDFGHALERRVGILQAVTGDGAHHGRRSEEHTSELQSLMRISYAVFCLNKTNIQHSTYIN